MNIEIKCTMPVLSLVIRQICLASPASKSHVTQDKERNDELWFVVNAEIPRLDDTSRQGLMCQLRIIAQVGSSSFYVASVKEFGRIF